ncbi:hypothetical protein ABZ769_30525 [Streptomyces olivoreticuli]
MTSWHLNSDQHLYTRHPEPQDWTTSGTSLYGYLDFPDATLRRFIAVHEAGHAVLDMAFGIPVAEIHLCEDLGKTPGTRSDELPNAAAWVKNGGQWSVSYMRYAAMCAAGERAQDRWLRENGLWNRERAWACERGASSDREQIEQQLRACCRKELHFNPSPAPGVQYRTVQAVADSALSHLWDRALRLAAAVDEHGHLTGRQAARYADLTYVAIPCDESESEGVAA